MQEKYLGQKKFSQSTQRRKDIKEFEVYKKEILLNSSRTKKTWRLCVLGVRFYINYSVTCLFDATMPEKYLGQKKISQRAQRRKDIKEYEAYKKDTLKLFASLKKLGVFAFLA
ncbi:MULTISPECIES: hypothetical protein [Segatella]|uniref:Uncharacterized protein n=1 Tax=Segatella bryantii TaxID=77095 RepID=A0AA37HYP5_SEGBR|nr:MULTISPECIES: hypothetical protein [Segatella]GJG28439.1 hypothetical protein PRRU23_21390 [Segatella bryantii]SEQ52616.1 hypothetical protein SAMN05444375_11028 [Segatella baroniae B14]